MMMEKLHQQRDLFQGYQKTLQSKLIKVAARVKILKTKVQIELPIEFYSKWAFEKSLWIFQKLRI
jgi:hypothetical protein